MIPFACVLICHTYTGMWNENSISLPAEAVANIAASKAKYFTVSDARKGYHQCPLNALNQLLTTFITPFGSFKFLRAPYGISSISEHYNRRMAEAFTGLSGFRWIVDNIVIYDNDAIEHAYHAKDFLQRCTYRQITWLNLDKCHFFQQEVTFTGFELCGDGYQVDPSITDAISNSPIPINCTNCSPSSGLWTSCLCPWTQFHPYWLHSELSSVLRQISSGQKLIIKHCRWQRNTLHWHPSYLSLIQTSPQDYTPMLDAMALASSSSNRTRMVRGA